MEPHRVGTPLFIADANVLIDYLNVDLSVLGKVAKHLGPVLVLRVVLRDEVRGLSAGTCTKLGLEVVDSTVEMLTLAAAAKPRPPCSPSMTGWCCSRRGIGAVRA